MATDNCSLEQLSERWQNCGMKVEEAPIAAGQRRGPGRFFPAFEVPEDWHQHVRLAEGIEGAEGKEGDGRPDRSGFLRGLAWSGAVRRYGTPLRPEVGKRLQHELAVIEEVGYADYFLIAWDICREAAERGIPTLARGSAADSLVCYCMGISTVCPLWFDLYFERFLNRERMQFSKLADIDIDFPSDQRDEMIEYVFERWGRDKVAMIGGFNRFHARAALGDIGKVFGLSEGEIRGVTRRLPRVAADAIGEALQELPFLDRNLPFAEPPYPEVLKMVGAVEDFPRHFSMHPCGIVISRLPLGDVMPLQPSGRGPQMSQFDMDAVEDMGFVKIDLLGQAGLAVLRDVRLRVRERHGVEIDYAALPWQDARTWDVIGGGHARGVHHIESPAMTNLLVQSHCRDMRCLCAVVSVIRPGAADESKKLAFTRRHQGFEPADFPHPSLTECLADTYGLCVYEEHILMVAEAFAGMNLGRADVLRRELVKMKSAERLAGLGREFRACALAHGRTEAEIEKVWGVLSRFNGYMFNKAHSASYAVEAYQGAYMKCRWPAEYLAAVLEHEGGFYSSFFYLLEARRLGIGVRGPDVNASKPEWRVEGGEGKGEFLRMPLRWIRGLGGGWLRRWQLAREQKAFTGLEDFVRRCRPRREEADLLLAAGALDAFGEADGRAHLYWLVHQLLGECPVVGDGDLFADSGAAVAVGLPERLSEPDERTRAEAEMKLLGYPLSVDPFLYFADGPRWQRRCPVARLGRFCGEVVTVAGLIVQARRSHSAKGEVMYFCTLADPTGFVECTFFPREYARHGGRLENGGFVEVRARVAAFENGRGWILEGLAAG